MSQEELALDTGVSPRHLSFLETGRSQPGRTMVLSLARVFELAPQDLNTLLVAAGVVAGLLAGAVVAQRMGGWRGMRRLLGKQRAPLLKLVRGALPSGALGAVIDAVGIEQIIGALLGTVPAERRPVAAKKRRRQRTRDLDEYEVDDIERAAAGLDDDDLSLIHI